MLGGGGHGGGSDRADLAIVVVSTNEVHWLDRCLTTVFEHAGTAALEVIVVDNSSTDGTREFVESRFPQAQVVTSPNRGFAYGNNRGLEHADARYLLLLNPDTEVCDGTFGELVDLLDARPDTGLAGVRQITADGELWPTIRRFPSISRALGEAFFCERWPVHPAWPGNACSTGPPTSTSVPATGPRGPSWWRDVRRCSARACSTSASSSTPRSPTCACASSVRVGRFAISPR